MYTKGKLYHQERFLQSEQLSQKELEQAAERALQRLERNAHKFGDQMVQAVDGILERIREAFLIIAIVQQPALPGRPVSGRDFTGLLICTAEI